MIRYSLLFKSFSNNSLGNLSSKLTGLENSIVVKMQAQNSELDNNIQFILLLSI